MGILDLNYSLYLCVSFACLLLTFNAKLLSPLQTSMCLLTVSPSLSPLPHSFCFWHMHAHSSHLLVYSCWIINFWAGWCDSNTHTHTQTLPWDWIDTPLCSAEGGIDIIPGLRPNTLFSLSLFSLLQKERERGRQREEGRQGREQGREVKKEGHHHLLSGNTLACIFSMCVCVYICVTRMRLLWVKGSKLRTRLAVKPYSAPNKIIDLFFHCSLSPLLPGLWASYDPLGWSSRLSFSSSSSHLSCTSPSYGCRGS